MKWYLTLLQVILVVSDEARNSLPEELGLGLVLTIYEAKGLEFDDVLLYNFFKDSEVRDSKPVYIGLTIYEAKGLEFDDILPYNFFKDFEMRDSRPVYFRSDHLRSQKS